MPGDYLLSTNPVGGRTKDEKGDSGVSLLGERENFGRISLAAQKWRVADQNRFDLAPVYQFIFVCIASFRLLLALQPIQTSASSRPVPLVFMRHANFAISSSPKIPEPSNRARPSFRLSRAVKFHKM